MTQHPTPPADLDSEALAFLQTPPDRHLMLIDHKQGHAVTRTGVTLGRYVLGPVYEVSAFGRPCVRQSIHVWAINGREYVGTYYLSKGDFARVKVKK